MKIVSYNVNSLRARVCSHGSLLKFLNSLDADIICLQETKLSRQELSADITMAEGYESFFSCTRTTRRGRIGYSGVATFCKVKLAFSSTEVTLPVVADEGFTGLLKCSRVGETNAAFSEVGNYDIMQGSDCLTKQELLKLDSEGRCIMTDHGHFVLFNIYGPCVQCNDSERFQFKLNFYKVLQRRVDALLGQGRRVIIMGDLNIAPSRIDSCDPGPDFDDNMCRKWLRTLLKNGGGPFSDAFRTFHPYRKEAFTCWSQTTGAEEFNYGTRIDLILVAGPCLHPDTNSEQHNFINCHIEECDIMSHFKRNKPDNAPKWQGGRSIKLEGSDHAPVYIKLREMPDVAAHDVPAFAVRYMPEVSGRQQSIVSLLQKRHATEAECSGISDISSRMECTLETSERKRNVPNDRLNEPIEAPSVINSCGLSLYSIQNSVSKLSEGRKGNQILKESCSSATKESSKSMMVECHDVMRKQTTLIQKSQAVQRKRRNESKFSQSSLRSFFVVDSTKTSRDAPVGAVTKDNNNEMCEQLHKSDSNLDTRERIIVSEMKESNLPTGQKSMECFQFNINCNQDIEKHDVSATDSFLEELKSAQDLKSHMLREKATGATLEWQKIQNLMSRRMPLCKGHGEPCVARVVKKAGPNIGRGFYVCARAKGPKSNPEARCDHFEWASSKGKSRGK